MLKLSPRMFAAAAFCMGTAIAGGEALAQFAPTPASPRQDTPRTEDDELTEDSRTGGALSRETPPADAPEVDEDFVPEPAVPADQPTVTAEEDVEIAGKVVGVAENRLTLMIRSEARAPARKVDFQVSEAARVNRNGDPADLTALLPGDSVRLETAEGDSTIVVRIEATSEPEGSVNSIRGNPNVVRDRDNQRRVRTPAANEEAVLPLGVEIYAINEVAMVTEMLAGGPAENGGVRIGDLIVAINGEPIQDPEGIEAAIAEAGAAELTIQRGDQRLTVSLSPTRVVEGSLVNPTAIRQNLSGYGRVVGPMDGAGVSAPVNGVGVNRGAVDGAGVELQYDVNDAVGPGVVIPNSAPEMREQAREFQGRQPGTNPRSNLEDPRRLPGSNPRDVGDSVPGSAVRDGAAGTNNATGQTGQTGTATGQGGTATGQGGAATGQTGTAGGQTGTAGGQTGTAGGQ